MKKEYLCIHDILIPRSSPPMCAERRRKALEKPSEAQNLMLKKALETRLRRRRKLLQSLSAAG